MVAVRQGLPSSCRRVHCNSALVCMLDAWVPCFADGSSSRLHTVAHCSSGQALSLGRTRVGGASGGLHHRRRTCDRVIVSLALGVMM